MCKNPQSCLFGNACTSAHSPDELKEWMTRHDFQIQQQQRVLMEKKQSTIPNIQSIRDLINESRRRRLPGHNLNVMCSFFPYVNKASVVSVLSFRFKCLNVSSMSQIF